MKILVVEDNFLAALGVLDLLDGLGHTAVGPIASVQEALQLVETETFDAGLIDIRVRGEMSFPVAQALRARGCPVCFATGYSRHSGIPEELADVPFLEKPISADALRSMLARLRPDAG